MPFVGSHIGPYEIRAPLGAGGMGEVYLARDAKLGRDVAIKVLPTAVAADAERRLRFAREARMLAALNHPNIGAIYGFEDGAHPALILELVEGDTLADRLRQGPIPVHEALAIARQIADALDAAHERGIVHRDLKPANIKVTPDGVVKVLDFGLAKALAPDPESAAARDLASSPTVTVGGTKDGVILGTAAYMSPEQARGKALDKRTDIWAFGCVLFEMLTGRRAFAGETTADVMAAILERGPEWDALPQETPTDARRLLQRCVERDPKRRLRDIADARAELDESRAPSSTGHSDHVIAPRAALGWWRAAALLLATSLAITIGVWAFATSARSVPPGDFISQTTATTLTDGDASSGAISPDGRSFVYVADRDGRPDVWVRQIAGGDPVRITNNSDEEGDLAFAPDGESIYFTRFEAAGFGIWRVGLLGGAARKIVERGRQAAPAPDGLRLAYTRFSPRGTTTISVSSVEGGEPQDLVVDLPAGASRPAWSPDARWLSYSVGGLFAPSNLFVIDVTTKAKRQVTSFSRASEGVFDYAWLPGNRHLVVSYVSGSEGQGRSDLGLMDVTDGSITRLAMAIRDGLTVPSLSRDGSRLLLTTARTQHGIWRVPLGPDPDANGRNAIELRDSVGEPMWTSLSQDRRTVLYSSSMIGSRNLWTMPVDTGAPPRQITSVPRSTAITHSSMSPDGQRVAFASSAAGRSDIWTQKIDGSDLRQLTDDQAASSWPVWSPDGTRIVYTSTLPSGRVETKLVPSTGGPSEHLIDGFFRGDWVRRPDGLGTWIVTSNAGSRILLIDVEKRAVIWEEPMLGTGLSLPVFSPDRRSISMPVRGERGRDSIWVLDVATRLKRRVATLPFRVIFRAAWDENGVSVIVNRQDQVTSVVLFDHFWTDGAAQ